MNPISAKQIINEVHIIHPFLQIYTHTNVAPSGELKVSHSLPTSSQLSWTPVILPEDKQIEVITGYRVQVVGPDSTREFPVMDATATSVEVSDLKPYTTYTFSVSPMIKAGTGPAISASSTTPQGGEALRYNYY